jgi:hypothetical protein
MSGPTTRFWTARRKAESLGTLSKIAFALSLPFRGVLILCYVIVESADDLQWRADRAWNASQPGEREAPYSGDPHRPVTH